MNVAPSRGTTFEADGEPPSTPGARVLDYATLDADLARWLARRETRLAATRRRPKRRSVYDRDGWLCRLCLRPVDRRLSLPHPHAATLDHMTPRAEGGSSDPDNLQTAHAICNHVRGTLPLSAVDHLLFAELFAAAATWAEAMSARDEARVSRARKRWFRRVRRIRLAFKAGGSGRTDQRPPLIRRLWSVSQSTQLAA
jgi:5-methylcytosine-specific restriction endonuclease McrA